MDFKKGDIVEYCGDEFEVLENHGDTGVVKELCGGTVISKFYWNFRGEKCRLKTTLKDWIHTGETESGLQVWAKQEITNGENYLKYEYRTEVGIVTYSDEIPFSKVNFLKGLVDIISTENNKRGNAEINQLIEDYTAKLERKQRKIEPLLKIKNTMDGFGSDIKSEIEYNKLDVEINTLKMAIEDLKWSLEEKE